MKEKSTIYICSSYHHVLISTIKRIITDDKNVDVVLCDDIPNYINLQGWMEKSKFFRHVYLFDKKKCKFHEATGIIDLLFKTHKTNATIVENEFKINLRLYDNVYVFFDRHILCRYLIGTGIHYHLIEDGIDYFKTVDQASSRGTLDSINKPWMKLRKLFNIGYIECGQNKYCIDIEVNDKSNLLIPDKKVKVCPKESIYCQLTQQKKKEIYSMFVHDKIELKEGALSAILLTTPFYEDKFVNTEEDQIKIYSELVDAIKKDGYTVFLKPHPRDKIDYSKHICGINILNKNVPVEVYQYNRDIRFDKVITIYSTSIEAFKNVKIKENLGLEYLLKYEDIINDWVKEKIKSKL